MQTLFFYGTLCHEPLLRAVLGHDLANLTITPGQLAGHSVSQVAGESFPIIHAAPDRFAPGLVVQGLTEADVTRLDFYESGYLYDLRPMTVETPGGPVTAMVYFAQDGAWQPGAPWDLSAWVAQWGAVTVDAAGEFLRQCGQIDGARVRLIWPYILARAWGRHLGQAPVPTTRRSGYGWDDIDYAPRPEGFDGFFALRSFEVRHRRFDGTMSETIRREAFVAYDAALLLPYDPVRDRVLLIEQFRFGPLSRRDPHPWVFEPIAGLVDAGEAPEDCVRREAMEEAGLDLHRIEPMMKVYASPGYSSEYFHCFLGLADLQDGDGRIGGLDDEHEDIRAHLMSYDEAMALLESGEINAGPLAMMLLWLGRERTRLSGLA